MSGEQVVDVYCEWEGCKAHEAVIIPRDAHEFHATPQGWVVISVVAPGHRGVALDFCPEHATTAVGPLIPHVEAAEKAMGSGLLLGEPVYPLDPEIQAVLDGTVDNFPALPMGRNGTSSSLARPEDVEEDDEEEEDAEAADISFFGDEEALG